eukprot:2610485-Amphidinium_carterae.2
MQNHPLTTGAGSVCCPLEEACVLQVHPATAEVTLHICLVANEASQTMIAFIVEFSCIKLQIESTATL